MGSNIRAALEGRSQERFGFIEGLKLAQRAGKVVVPGARQDLAGFPGKFGGFSQELLAFLAYRDFSQFQENGAPVVENFLLVRFVL